MIAKILIKHLEDVGLGTVLVIQGLLISDEIGETRGKRFWKAFQRKAMAMNS